MGNIKHNTWDRLTIGERIELERLCDELSNNKNKQNEADCK